MVTYGRFHPQQTNHWGGVISVIHLDHRFGNDCLAGLEEFSHAEILFVFHRASEREAYPPLRPEGRPDLPRVGVFAQRGPRRPNRLGAAICEIVQITGHLLTLKGLDAVVGTPILDIKRRAAITAAPVHGVIVSCATMRPARRLRCHLRGGAGLVRVLCLGAGRCRATI